MKRTLMLAGAAIVVACGLFAYGARAQPFIHEGTLDIQVKRAFVNVAASQTDAVVVAAVATKKIRVLGLIAQDAATTTSITFNSKPAGAGTAISPLFQLAVNGGITLPIDQNGWVVTNVGEGLSVTTGTGTSTGILCIYAETP